MGVLDSVNLPNNKYRSLFPFLFFFFSKETFTRYREGAPNSSSEKKKRLNKGRGGLLATDFSKFLKKKILGF